MDGAPLSSKARRRSDRSRRDQSSGRGPRGGRGRDPRTGGSPVSARLRTRRERPSSDALRLNGRALGKRVDVDSRRRAVRLWGRGDPRCPLRAGGASRGGGGEQRLLARPPPPLRALFRALPRRHDPRDRAAARARGASRSGDDPRRAAPRSERRLHDRVSPRAPAGGRGDLGRTGEPVRPPGPFRSGAPSGGRVRSPPHGPGGGDHDPNGRAARPRSRDPSRLARGTLPAQLSRAKGEGRPFS
jgi:hypothetical protein